MPPVYSKFLVERHSKGMRRLCHELQFDRRMTKKVVKSAVATYKRENCVEGKIRYFLKKDKTILTSDLFYLLPDVLCPPPAELDPRVREAIKRYREAKVDTHIPIEWLDNILHLQIEIDAQREKEDADHRRMSGL